VRRELSRRAAAVWNGKAQDALAARPAARSFSSSAPRSLCGSWGNAKASAISSVPFRSRPSSWPEVSDEGESMKCLRILMRTFTRRGGSADEAGQQAALEETELGLVQAG